MRKPIMEKLADNGHWGILDIFMDYECDPAKLCQYLVHSNENVRKVAKRQFERLMKQRRASCVTMAENEGDS